MVIKGKQISKNEIQENAVELAKKYNHLLLSWATGTGKSLGFIKIQEALNPPMTYIVCNETAHIDNWIAQYKEHGKEHLLAKTKIFCYASLHKYKNTKVGLLGLDETHHALSDIRINYLSSITYDKVVALTATLSEGKLELLNETFNTVFHKSNITLDDAIQGGLVKVPTIYIVPLELNYFKKNCYFEEVRGIAAKRIVIEDDIDNKYKYFDREKYKNVHFKFLCTEQFKYLLLNQDIEQKKLLYNNSKQLYLKNMWLQSLSKRKAFMGECKTPYLQKLINILGNKRYICFTASIKQANIIGTDADTIHSKKSNNAKTIEDFNNKTISRLIAVNMLQEGQNLTDIEAAIITQLDAEALSFIQRTGRGLRAENPEIYVLYYKDTRDEEFLQNVYNTIDNKFIKILELC